VSLHPKVLNLRSMGRWITCYIGLPEGYDVSDIDVDTIRLEDIMEAQRSNVQGTMLMVKFDRRALIEYLDGTPGPVTLTVSGELIDGTPFQDADTILCIGRKN